MHSFMMYSHFSEIALPYDTKQVIVHVRLIFARYGILNLEMSDNELH